MNENELEFFLDRGGVKVVFYFNYTFNTLPLQVFIILNLYLNPNVYLIWKYCRIMKEE